jgi:hypothetical protein
VHTVGDARVLVADILHYIHACRLQDRIVNIFTQQARVVATPGAHDALLCRARLPYNRWRG